MISDIVLYIAALLIATLGGSWLVKYAIRNFHVEDLPTGFQNAGRLIGILERLLIFILLSIDYLSLIGFLLTIKAIYRYGDIQGENTVKMKLSEYFLIGTLLSFAWVLVIYLLYSWVTTLV